MINSIDDNLLINCGVANYALISRFIREKEVQVGIAGYVGHSAGQAPRAGCACLRRGKCAQGRRRQKLLARGKDICLTQTTIILVNSGLHSRILALALLLLLALAAPASAYGKSVEDLVGSFSIEKTIKIGSSSESFSSVGATDPLTPPQSGAVGPFADDQPPNVAGFAFQPQQISAAWPQTVNLTAHLIDDQAVWAAEAIFSGPQGEEAFALFSAQNRTAGTAKDGYYNAKMVIPQSNETGKWHLQNLTLVDREGNRRVLAEADLRGLSLPTVITVI
jgi:hypothetical protein